MSLASASTSTLCSYCIVQAENERENLEEDNACLAEVLSKGVSSQIILYLHLKMATIFILPY